MSSTYTKKQFIEDVKAEAVVLRKHATKEELERLDIPELRASSTMSCIYGQMTGDCNSERAIKLIKKGCKRFFHNCLSDAAINGFPSIKQSVNGKTVRNLQSSRGFVVYHISSIEAYIALPNAKNANLIAYLRGEIDTLDL